MPPPPPPITNHRHLHLEAILDILAHDVRSPLTVARGFFDVARSESRDEAVRQLLDEADEGLSALESLTVDLRTATRPHRTHPRPILLDPADLFTETAAALPLPLTLLDPILPCCCDPTLLRVVLLYVMTRAHTLDPGTPLTLQCTAGSRRISYALGARAWPPITARFGPLALARAMLAWQDGWLEISVDRSMCRLWLPAHREETAR